MYLLNILEQTHWKLENALLYNLHFFEFLGYKIMQSGLKKFGYIIRTCLQSGAFYQSTSRRDNERCPKYVQKYV